MTDSVTQADVQVLGDAPAMAMGSVYQAIALALASAAQNATNAQQQNFALAQAVTTRCVQVLLGAAAPAKL
ncbi:MULTISPECIES: RebB family R body protein [Bradyrhizobium]|uniref:RebB family R body protein n=1 Tax=Bradyrhizobium iriomotense TaxID=441950 RepID=UPI001B8A01A0|nr:RebB family R body protein [Bradyrhizobium iriomotense]